MREPVGFPFPVIVAVVVDDVDAVLVVVEDLTELVIAVLTDLPVPEVRPKVEETLLKARTP